MLFLLLVLFVGLLLGKYMLSNWVGLVSQVLEGYMCVHYLYQGAAYMGVPQDLDLVCNTGSFLNISNFVTLLTLVGLMAAQSTPDLETFFMDRDEDGRGPRPHTLSCEASPSGWNALYRIW